MERWHGKTAVVTGAGSGIGSGIALELANAGLKVIGLDIQVARVEELSSKVSGDGFITPRYCDVSKSDDIADTFRWIATNCDGVHVLVNNAGFFHLGYITDVGTNTLTDEQIVSTIDTNIKGAILCSRHAVTSMKRAGFDGHIININSIAGHYVPFSCVMNVYSSSKYAITAFTSALLQELAEFKSKVKVTSVSPGLTNTNMAQYLQGKGLPTLQPKDLADAVLYVLSTPPHVNINEITVTPVMEKRQ